MSAKIDIPRLMAFYLSDSFKLTFDEYVEKYTNNEGFRNKVHDVTPKEMRKINE